MPNWQTLSLSLLGGNEKVYFPLGFQAKPDLRAGNDRLKRGKALVTEDSREKVQRWGVQQKKV